jgi:sugar-specific transcriptional regulator TrmB
LRFFIRFASPVTASMFLTLTEKGFAFARELAEVAGIESRHVYSYLRYWILKGFVEVSKAVRGVNLYSLSKEARKVAYEIKKFAEEVIQKLRGKRIPRKIIEEAEKRYEERFGKHMPEHYKLILCVFIEYALSKSSPYIAVKPGEETLPQVIKTIILQRYGRNLDAEEIIEALKELEIAKIVYIDRKRFKARLDKSLV